MGSTLISEEIMENSELRHSEIELLVTMLHRYNPKKILEVGVAAGGSTRVILHTVHPSSVVYSVDIDSTYYRNRSKAIGYMVDSEFTEYTRPQWFLYTQQDISACIEKIGQGIDFVILDTVHAMPGEFLSFLAILPFLDNESVLILHDISLHINYKLKKSNLSNYQKNAYCTSLLYNALNSKHKQLCFDMYPNCGALLLNKREVISNLYMVVNNLFIDWGYLPSHEIINDTMKIIECYYPKNIATLISNAIQYNIKLYS